MSKGVITSTSDNTSTILARSEVIIPIQAGDQELSEQQNILINAQEISQDVLCSHFLDVIKNNRILINVKRTTDNYNTNTSCFVTRNI